MAFSLRRSALTRYAFLFLPLLAVLALTDSRAAGPPQLHDTRSHPPLARLPVTTRSSEHLFGLSGLVNVGRVTPEIYRGAQPASNGYETLRKMGIKTVLNLRTSMSEKNEVEAAGMRSIEIPLGTFTDGDKEKVDKVVAVMADPANRPLFVHCRQGRDRTGIVVAAYRMKMEGWSHAVAEAEMDSFGFNDVWVNLRQFLRRYAAGLDRNAWGEFPKMDSP